MVVLRGAKTSEVSQCSKTRLCSETVRNGIDVYSLSRLLGHFDTQETANSLRGLEQDSILEIGRYSPLNDVKI